VSNVLLFRRLIIVIVLLSATLLHCRNVQHYPLINCYIRHLKNVRDLSENFPEHKVTEQLKDCSKIIENSREKFYSDVKEMYKSIDEYKGDCVVATLKSLKHFEKILKDTVYQTSTTMTETEKIEATKEIMSYGNMTIEGRVLN
jgi:hypothetical protein